MNENRSNPLLYKHYGHKIDSDNNDNYSINSEVTSNIRWYHREPDFYVHKRRKFDFAPVMIAK